MPDTFYTMCNQQLLANRCPCILLAHKLFFAPIQEHIFHPLTLNFSLCNELITYAYIELTVSTVLRSMFRKS